MIFLSQFGEICLMFSRCLESTLLKFNMLHLKNGTSPKKIDSYWKPTIFRFQMLNVPGCILSWSRPPWQQGPPLPYPSPACGRAKHARLRTAAGESPKITGRRRPATSVGCLFFSKGLGRSLIHPGSYKHPGLMIPSMSEYRYINYICIWLVVFSQPIWKIWSSNWSEFPQLGVGNKKYLKLLTRFGRRWYTRAPKTPLKNESL